MDVVAWPQILDHVTKQAVTILDISCPLLCTLVHLPKLHLRLSLAVTEYSDVCL